MTLMNTVPNTSNLLKAKYWGRVLLLFALYFIFAKIGLTISAYNNFAALVWPPSGIALAALLIWGPQFWPVIFIAALSVNYATGAPLLTALFIAIGNSLEGVLGAYLCRRVSFQNSFARLKDVFSYIGRAVILSTLVGATIGVSSLWMSGLVPPEQLEQTWLQWWAGDALSILILSPILLVYSSPAITKKFQWNTKYVGLFLAFIFTITISSIFAFDMFSSFQVSALFSGYMVLPLLLWASMRFGQRGAVFSNFAISSIAIVSAAMGAGPFVSSTPIINLVNLMIFVSAISLIGLVIGAVTTERESENSALQKSLAYSSAMMSSSMDCIFTIDHAGSILDFNPAAERTYGYQRYEILFKSIDAIIFNRDESNALNSTGLTQYIQENLDKIKDSRIEMTSIRKDQSVFPVELTITQIANTSPSIFMCYTRDITVRKTSEAVMERSHKELEKTVEIKTTELKKTQERFKLLIDTVQDYAIYMLDPEGYITTWNSGAERIKGYAASEIIGKHFSIFYTQDSLNELFPDLELATARTNGRFENEGLRVRKDGSTFWANVTITALYDKEGTHTGYAKITRDVTERKVASERLHQINEDLERRVAARTHELLQNEMQLRGITNVMPNLVGYLDRDARFLFANEACRNWLAPSKASIVGYKLGLLLEPHLYADLVPHIKNVLSGVTTTFERNGIRDNKSFSFLVTFAPEFDENKHVNRFILVATDIQDQKRIENELKIAKENADIANSAKSAFLANMSHEIRTPLGAVLGFSDLIVSSEMSPAERQKSVEAIKRNGMLLSNIINDILDLSKVEANKLDIEQIQIPLDEVISDISTLLNLEAAQKGVRFQIIQEGDLPYSIKTDPLRLRQILLNIVGNAIKFTDKGSVEVAIKQTLPNRIVFVVKDTGRGIAPEHISKLFAPFSQADASTTRKYGGTGLGLILSKKLAQALSGDVVLTESTLGIGSTFTITIDHETPKQSDQVKDSNEVEAAAHATTSNSLLNHNILLVDDSPDNQVLVGRFLEMAGATVHTAKNGREGVDLAQKGDYDLILMDLQMPEMDGYQALKLLKDSGYSKPIIALTAHAMQEERRRCLESGFIEHLSKPIDRHVLIRAVVQYSQIESTTI